MKIYLYLFLITTGINSFSQSPLLKLNSTIDNFQYASFCLSPDLLKATLTEFKCRAHLIPEDKIQCLTFKYNLKCDQKNENLYIIAFEQDCKNKATISSLKVLTEITDRSTLYKTCPKGAAH